MAVPAFSQVSPGAAMGLHGRNMGLAGSAYRSLPEPHLVLTNCCLGLLADGPEAEGLWLGLVATCLIRLSPLPTFCSVWSGNLGVASPRGHPGDPSWRARGIKKSPWQTPVKS